MGPERTGSTPANANVLEISENAIFSERLNEIHSAEDFCQLRETTRSFCLGPCDTGVSGFFVGTFNFILLDSGINTQ